jgi:hypothetical protein
MRKSWVAALGSAVSVGRQSGEMTKNNQLATLMTFLLLGYLTLTMAGALVFTFIW